MAGIRTDWAYAPSIINQANPNPVLVAESGTKLQAKNLLTGNGMVWPKNPSSLPAKARFHKMPVEDDWWWFRAYKWPLRNPKVDYHEGEFRSYLGNNMELRCFGKDAKRLVGKRWEPILQSNREVFAKLAKQDGLSDETLQQYRESGGFRQTMHKKHAQLMKTTKASGGGGGEQARSSASIHSASTTSYPSRPASLSRSASEPGSQLAGRLPKLAETAPMRQQREITQNPKPLLWTTTGGLGESWCCDYNKYPPT